MEAETNSNNTFSFGDFALSGARRSLLKNGETVSLNSKTLDLLLVLVENHGQVLSKNELLEKVWENQFVEENNLSVQIAALRKIFGEKKGEHQFIATIPGKGYKFIADVVLSDKEKPFEQNLATNPYSQTENEIAPVDFISASENSLIGRNREIKEIINLLQDENVRLVTLTGAGGSGKTSLARTIANGLKTRLPDDVFFIELAAANKNEIVISTIAQTLGITESPAKPLIETLKDFLRQRRMLLVLDNFEQIISAAPLVKEILTDAPFLKILITSRAALRLNIENEFLVTPLDLPPTDTNFLIADPNEFPAIALFYIRAKTAKPSFVLTAENIPSIVEICRRLDGLPLAIELAAARVKLLSPQSILDRLENSLKILTGGGNDLPPRQQTMRNAISWSYDLLDENEKNLFRQLAIFAGGFTVEAAEKVFENTFSNDRFSSSEIQTLDLLESLVNNSLLTTKDQADGNVRLTMLEVVREFALECLEQIGETEIVRRNHSKFFLELVEKAAPLLHGEKGNEWLDKLDDEHDNLRGALVWSLKNDAETVARIAGGLRFFWLNRSYLSEGLGWCTTALEAVDNSNSKARADLILANGVFMRNQGNFDAAQKMYERVLEENSVINNSQYIIKANHGLAAIAVLRKDFVSAQPFIEEALAISRELNDEVQTAYSLASLGDLEMSRGNFSAARPLIEECLELSKKLGNNKLLTTNYFNLGTIDYFENSYQSAIFNFTESLRIALEMSNKTMISCALEGFAALALKNGSPEYSAKIAGAAEQMRESIGYNLEPAEEIFRNDYLPEAKAVLGEKRFKEIYAQGRKLELGEITSLVTKTKFQTSDEEFTEIIIETHKYKKIIIEEIE